MLDKCILGSSFPLLGTSCFIMNSCLLKK